MRFVLRGFRLLVVAVTVALLTAVPMSAQLLHGSGDDDSCSPGAVRHDPSEHRLRSGAGLAGLPHCTICHWWMSGGRFKSPTLPTPNVSDICLGLVTKTLVAEPQLVAAASRPARAPPIA